MLFFLSFMPKDAGETLKSSYIEYIMTEYSMNETHYDEKGRHMGMKVFYFGAEDDSVSEEALKKQRHRGVSGLSVDRVRQITPEKYSLLGGYTDDQYDENNNLILSMYYEAPGLDGLWFSSDDLLGGYARYEYDEKGTSLYAQYSDPGRDQKWHTKDDQVKSYITFSQTPDGVAYERHFDGSGFDQTWFTKDDNVEYIEAGRHPWVQQKELLEFRSYSPGLDGTWLTGDDEIASPYRSGRAAYTKFIFDEQFLSLDPPQNLSRHDHVKLEIDYGKRGKDLLWFTPDDIPKRYTKNSFDQKGRIIESIEYKGPGKDQVWFTQDDEMEHWVKHQYTSSAQLSFVFTGPGKDQVWQSDDDLLERYWKEERLGKEGLTRTTNFTGPGEDSLWQTPDDKIERYWVEQNTQNTKNSINYDVEEPGPDGLWYTGDDVVSHFRKHLRK